VAISRPRPRSRQLPQAVATMLASRSVSGYWGGAIADAGRTSLLRWMRRVARNLDGGFAAVLTRCIMDEYEVARGLG
jgi:hypothetical protein